MLTNRNVSFQKGFDGMMLPYGNGRSYGDSCLNPGGNLLLTRGLDRFIAFNPETGLLCCEAGVTLDEILTLTVPQGWFLPVTPGTRFVTVGGAIANDVHGKNHHRFGTFGHHVVAFELLRSNGEVLRCSPDENTDYFTATIGGLGLTGLISWSEIKLRRIRSSWMDTESIRFGTLSDFFALSADSADTHEYSVAWVDCLARGKALGRGYFIRANHCSALESEHAAPAGSRLSIPFVPPTSLVNPLTLKVFNSLYYHRQRRERLRLTQHYQPYFYPLDSIRYWNRMYGPPGFLQHQCVLPPEHARDGIAELLAQIAHSGTGSFLAVLKDFGMAPSMGLISFPRPGTTLALDFPNSGPDVFRLLDRLDDVVVEAGGAVYPAKDARMSPMTFKRGYPMAHSFTQYIDPSFSSGFWRRVTESS